jgi:magnesium transporter
MSVTETRRASARCGPTTGAAASVWRVRVLTSLDRAELTRLRERDEFFWLDLISPSDEDVELIGELFAIHPLAIEDSRKFGQRPKLDDFENYVFVVFYGAERKDKLRLIEVHLVISGSYVITIRRQQCEELDALCRLLERRDHGDEQFVVYRVFDALTDSFFPILTTIDDEIDEIEDEIIVTPTDEQLAHIFRLKRELVELRRVVTPERDLFARAVDQIALLPGLEPATRDYFRDVYDHLIRISDLIDSYRDLLTGAMDVYLSTVSNRLNQVMKQLTVIATIFLPLTFVTGFFGQNFGWMVEHVDSLGAFLGFGGGGILLAAALLFGWFKRSGYI